MTMRNHQLLAATDAVSNRQSRSIRSAGASKLRIALSIAALLTTISAYVTLAQGVGISESSITPDSSAILELHSSVRGFLAPRMTTSQRNAIGSPAAGLLVYNTTSSLFNFWNGSAWTAIQATSGGVQSLSGTANRITISGTASDPVIDIAGNYVGQSSITTLGTIGTGTWQGTKIGIAYGGTNSTSTPTNGGIAYGDGSAYQFSSAGLSGQVLRSSGAGAPTWSTATYPATAGSTGNILRSDGTNFVSTPVTFAQAVSATANGTTNATGVMMGLGGSITPLRSGSVLVIISGELANSSNNSGGQVQIRYGTGSAPANGASMTGTAVGGLVHLSKVNGAGSAYPFSLNAIVTGLTTNTAHWIDVSLATIGGGTANIANVSISVIEL
jgi:hypothetical protein